MGAKKTHRLIAAGSRRAGRAGRRSSLSHGDSVPWSSQDGSGKRKIAAVALPRQRRRHPCGQTTRKPDCSRSRWQLGPIRRNNRLQRQMARNANLEPRTPSWVAGEQVCMLRCATPAPHFEQSQQKAAGLHSDLEKPGLSPPRIEHGNH